MKKNILVLLVISMMLVFITGCGNDNSGGSNTYTGTNPYSNGGSGQKYTAKELEKNIVSSGAVTAKGKLVVFATNNNSVPVDMSIEVEFYDANGVIVGSDDDALQAVGAGAEVAVEMWSTPNAFDNYKIYVDVEQTNNTSYHDKVEVTHNDNGKDIIVQVKNNSEDEISYVSVSVVYYQGETVVGIDDDLESGVKPGRAANFTLSYPTNKNYDKVRYDTYKVFVNEAYSYTW